MLPGGDLIADSAAATAQREDLVEFGASVRHAQVPTPVVEHVTAHEKAHVLAGCELLEAGRAAFSFEDAVATGGARAFVRGRHGLRNAYKSATSVSAGRPTSGFATPMRRASGSYRSSVNPSG
eukprot:6604738-Alexandrium_andersonii.AAC.1